MLITGSTQTLRMFPVKKKKAKSTVSENMRIYITTKDMTNTEKNKQKVLLNKVIV